MKEYNLPETITLGTSLIKVERENNSVVYIFELDELIYDLNVAKQHYTYDMARNAVSVDAKTNYLMSFFKKKGMDIKWRMTGSISQENFEILIKNGEY